MISNQDSFEAFDALIAATPDKPTLVVAPGTAVMSSLQIAEILAELLPSASA